MLKHHSNKCIILEYGELLQEQINSENKEGKIELKCVIWLFYHIFFLRFRGFTW